MNDITKQLLDKLNANRRLDYLHSLMMGWNAKSEKWEVEYFTKDDYFHNPGAFYTTLAPSDSDGSLWPHLEPIKLARGAREINCSIILVNDDNGWGVLSEVSSSLDTTISDLDNYMSAIYGLLHTVEYMRDKQLAADAMQTSLEGSPIVKASFDGDIDIPKISKEDNLISNPQVWSGNPIFHQIKFLYTVGTPNADDIIGPKWTIVGVPYRGLETVDLSDVLEYQAISRLLVSVIQDNNKTFSALISRRGYRWYSCSFELDNVYHSPYDRIN